MNLPALRRWLVPLFVLVSLARAVAANPPPTQVYYVPFPEDNQLAGFSGINAAAVDPLAVFVTFSAATDNTVIYYDHWEDGYERDITNPVQSTTLIYGDGNPANGYPPGNAADLIPAGTVFSLRNYVDTNDLSALDFDARDKVASYKPISLTKTCYPASTNSLLAGCVEVFEHGLWGTEYRVPVGTDMPTSTAGTTLTNDYDIFSYTAISVMAGARGATVQIDADNDGSYEQTVSLSEGENAYVTDVHAGAKIVSDHPVQVVFFSGRIGSTYQSRDTSLLPTYRWSSSYYNPVTTDNGGNYRTVTFLYNPSASPITVSYDYRSSATAYTTATVSVPAGGNARVDLSPAATGHSGAYHFYTTGPNPPVFYAMSAVDGGNTSTGSNQAYDGGFTLVGEPSLTTQVLLSLGIGRDPYSATNPTENGNPMWITTVGNGHTPATIYVDYNGDNAGSLTDPNGNKYDVAYSLRELEQQKLFDPDGDQSGMLVYSLDPTVKIAAAWAQDPGAASTAQPGLDVGTLVPPLREGGGGKTSSVVVDEGGDGEVSAGDTLEYDIRGANSARAAIPGPFAVTDNLPSEVDYVPGSTKYRFTVGGSWQAWTGIPDDGSGTPFPLDGTGFSVPGTLGISQQLQVVFQATVKPREQLAGETITNTGSVEISPYGLLLPVEWTDTVYGSIGDRIWIDADGDGIQDGGEAGLPGIDVYVDLNDNGVWDSGEPLDTTDANGNYLLPGLTAGTYTVRVDPADIAAANVGYGPTYDLDGNATAHVAVVTLGIAEDRVDADFGYRVGASVGDRVWMDRDGDGVQENGEPGLNGVRVYIDLDNDDTYDIGEPATITSGDGTYYIGNLDPGTYAVRVDASTLPSGSTQTYDLNGGLDHEASVTLIAAEHRGDLDFGYRGTLSIGDLVWEDANADGVSAISITYNVNNGRIDVNQDGSYNNSDDGFIGSMRIIDGYVDIDNDNSTPIDNGDDGTFLGVNIVNGGFDMNNSGTISTTGSNDDGQVVYNTTEPGIANIRVFIDIDNDGVFDANEPSAVTDSSGFYSIGNLPDGNYVVRVDTSTVPASYAQTYDLTSPLDHSASVTLSGSSRTDVDFAYRNSASIGDFVWNDRDADGVQDPGEPGIEGVLVYIDADNDNIFDQGVETFAITDLNGYYLIENVPAGSHNVRVDFGTLPQGSTQTYDLSGILDHEASRTVTVGQQATDVDFGYRATASVGDYVWNDIDADGVQDGGETGISGVRVYLDINGNGVFDSATEPSATTDGSGAYTIGSMLPGIYTARVDVSTLPAGYVQTYDLVGGLDHSATVSLSASQTRTDVDFGYTQQVVIGDRVWDDADADGQQDVGENGIDGVTVTAFHAATDTIAASTVTSGGGAYSFSLMPGTYYLVFTKPAGYEATLADQGNDSSDSDADVTSGRTANVTLTGGQSNLTLDAGYFQPATIGDFVWNDANANGQQDSGEPGLDGVSVTLFRPGFGPDGIAGNSDDATAVATTTTAGGGAYAFDGLRPGTYQVEFGNVSGYSRTIADQGADASDSDANAGTGLTAGFSVSAGTTDNTIDAGYFQPATIGDFVWNDSNANGQQDSGEPGLDGVSVTLYRPGYGPDGIAGNGDDAAAVATTATSGGGAYSFGGLRPGTYQVQFGTLSGYSRTLADQGADAGDSDANAGTGLTAGFSVSAGTTIDTIDAGYFQSATIGDFVWNDSNANGQQDSGEPGLDGVSVTLYRPGYGPDGIAGNSDDATAVATTTTSGGGAYSFGGLPPGIYQVGFGSLSGYNRTPADQGADASDSDANAGTGLTANIPVSAGATDNTIDAGYYQPGTVFGHLYIDTNGNGVQDGAEPDLADVDIVVTDVNGGTQTVSTDANGDWTATVPPGLTTADVDESDPQYPTGHTQTEGDDPTSVTVAPAGSADAGNDGYFLPGIISGSVLADTDDDGDGDVPLENVVVRLLDSLGNPVLDGFGDPVTTLTLADGSYQFGGLPPGDYCVVQDQPSGYVSVSDTDGPNDNVIGNVTPITVTAGATSGGNDFIEIELGTISGTVLTDDDNNGSGDSPLSGVVINLLDGSGNPVLDGFGSPIQVATDASGFYQFTLVPTGTYRVSQNQPAGYGSVSDVDGANNNVIGDETPIVMTPGLDVTGRDFVEIEFGAISGSVLADVDDNGTGEAPLAGVTLTLLDGAGDPVATTTTDALGGYRFDDLFPGIYQVLESQPSGYGSVSDVDGGNPNHIGNVAAITVNPGQEVGGRDFIEIELGTISGYVFAGATPLAGVTLTLLDEFGNPVDGDPDTPGVQPITTVTNGSGFYQFNGVIPGVYQVGETQPYGYDSFGDVDGGDIDIIGDVSPITLLPGQHSQNNNFVETLDTCPDDWTHWKFLHPAETPGGNPDADSYDNFAEFAFAMPYDDGSGSPWLGATAWIIQPSTLAPGTLEGVFVRPKGAPLNVVYNLEYAATPGNPTVWQTLVIDLSNSTAIDNGDCTETVTIHDLETLTGLTGGNGIVRIRAELDDDGGNDEIDHTSYAETEGWQETELGVCCRTFNNPFLRESVFTGTISAVSGQDLTFAVSGGSADIGSLLGSGTYFLEVMSGENEGHRFDIVSASGNTVTVASDSVLDSPAAPFNTKTGAPPADLTGDSIAIHRHWTLGELFPADAFGATASQTTADQVQLYAAGAWTILWNYDDLGTPRWVDIADSGMADQAGIILAPGQGMFFNNRTAVTSILAYGEVRSNDFVRPLPVGNALVGGGYPVDQTPIARTMTVAGGFFGGTDFKYADSIFVWRKDANATANGYDTYYLVNGAPVNPSFQRWVRVGDASLTARGNETLLLGNRSVFVRSKDGLPAHTTPAPWSP